MYGRQIVCGAHGGCKHLVRYVSSKVCTDHAYKQAGSTSRKPRELHTCISDSKWRAMKALNLDEFAAYSEGSFKSRKKGDCSINVVKDDVSKETPCIINIYLKSSRKKRRKDDVDDDDDSKHTKREFAWEEINTSKTNWVETQTKVFTPRDPVESDANILRSKLLAVKVKKNDENQMKSGEPPKAKCQELYAQRKLLCYNVSVYNCKTTRNMEYQAKCNSKKVMSEMIHLAYQQSEVSGVSRFLSFCKNLLSTDVKTNQTNTNETRIDTTRKWKVAQVFRPHSAGFTPTIKPRISPRTLSDFNAFKTTGFGAQVSRLQRCNFSSKSSSDKKGEKEEGKKSNCSSLEQCVKKIFCEIKKTCFGEAKDAKKTTSAEQKTSAKDECLEKSLTRLKQISPPSTTGGTKEKGQIDKKEGKTSTGPADVPKKEMCKGKGAGPEKQATNDDTKAKAKVDEKGKICSRLSPLPIDASKKEKTKEPAKETIKEKGAESARDSCKKDSPSKKQERSICAKDPQVPTCKTDVPKSAKDSCKKEDSASKKQGRPICAKDPQVPTCKTDVPKSAKDGCKKEDSASKKQGRPICAKDPQVPTCKTDVPKSAKDGCKKEDSASKKQGRPICAKDPQVPTCTQQQATGTTKTESRDTRCIQDGDSPKEEFEESASCGGKGKRDPCKKYRIMWDQKMAAKKKDSCAPEKIGNAKSNTSCDSEVKKDTCSQGGTHETVSKSKKDTICGNVPKRDICSQSGAKYNTSRRNMSKKDSCSQGGTNEKTPKSKKDTTCKNESKKTCSKGGTKKDTSSRDVAKKDTCGHQAKKDTFYESVFKQNIFTKDGVKEDTGCKDASKKDTCSSGGTKEKTSKSKKGTCSPEGTHEKTFQSEKCINIPTKDTCFKHGEGKETTCSTVSKKSACFKGGTMEKGTCSQGGAKGDTPNEGVSKQHRCSTTEKASTSKKDDTCASVSKKDTCSQGGAKGDTPSGAAAKKDTCSQGRPKKETKDSCSGGEKNTAGKAKTKDDCDKLRGGDSKKDPCSQSGIREETSTSKKDNTCARAHKKDSPTCSQGETNKKASKIKKDPCSSGEASKKDTCSQGGAKGDTPTKKDPCSQSDMNEKTTSKKDSTCTSVPKSDICSQGGAKGGVTKKDPCSQGGAKGDTPSGGAAKKDTCSQGRPKKETKDSCSGGEKNTAGKAKTKDDCDKFVAAKHKGISGVCGSSSAKNECENEEDDFKKCEGPHGGDQIRRRNLKAKTHQEEDIDNVKDKRYNTVVEAWDPPHDIMNTLGPFLDDANEDEIDDYFGDSYPNHMYYMYTREFFYDVNAMLRDCRQPQPVAMFKGKEPIRTEDSREDD